MSIQVRKTAERDLTITLGDTFDFSCVEDFRNAYENQSECSIKSYIIDFRNTQYMDSSALGMLICMQKFVQTHNGIVKLVHTGDNIRKILSISRFDKIFAIE